MSDGQASVVVFFYEEKIKMPKTKFESVVFTAITAWIMVYIMTLYNKVLAMGSFTNETFLIALKGMWVEFVIKTGRQTDRDHLCNPGIHSCVTGSAGKYYGNVLCIWIYKPVYSELHYDILQKLHYGNAGTAVHRRTNRKSIVPCVIQKNKRGK